MYFILSILLVLLSPALNHAQDPLDDLRNDILSEQTMQNVGGVLNQFMHSEGAKHLGDALAEAAGGEGAGDVLRGLGQVLGKGGGVDPSILGAVMGALGGGDNQGKEGGDMNILGSILGGLMGGQNQGGDFWTYVPMLLQTANAFLGPDAERRAKSHSGHAELMPPVLEKLHIWFDHFINSEMGNRMFSTIGAEKFIRIFADENGRLSYQKFIDMLENHSFRKHWIRMVTSRIADTISYFADSKTQKKYLTAFQHVLNSLLKSQGFPKATLFDQSKPTESISAMINYFTKHYFKIQISSKQYVKPAVAYIQELFKLAETRGIVNVNSHELSDKLADTINLEMIEPIARVNRGYRFAKKVPVCAGYVMCLVNQHPEEGPTSLPGLKTMLSKSSSLVLSWFLSSSTGTSFWELYAAITHPQDCQPLYNDACHDFHLEEIKVKENYVHNEL